MIRSIERSKVSKIDALKENIRAWRMNPEQISAREALNQAAPTPVSPDEYKDSELQIPSKTLRELARKNATEAL